MKYFLSLVAIFKNEHSIIKEWIEHYLMEGVDHFYLIDNGSDDAYRPRVEPYLNTKQIEIAIDPTPHMQTAHYNNYYLRRIKEESEWIMVVDLDEFMYARKGYRKISDYLRTLNDQVVQVYVPWKLFGSSGFLEQPVNCIESFTRRTQYNHVKTNGMISTELMFVKTLSRTQTLTQLGIHSSCHGLNFLEITSDGVNANRTDPSHQVITEQSLEASAIHCNHYPIQSFDWFYRVKMTRGSANVAKNDHVRNIGYFNSFDIHSNQIDDHELKNKRAVGVAFYYGVGHDHYVNVTHQVLSLFMNPVNGQVKIDRSVVFNHHFGDPAPDVEKYFIVQQANHLCIYPETDHGDLIIKTFM